MSKRQADRIKTFSDAMAAEPQSILKAITQVDVLPKAIGGNREIVPMCHPLAQDDPQRIATWMSRTKPGLLRGQVPECRAVQEPATRIDPLKPCTQMTVDE